MGRLASNSGVQRGIKRAGSKRSGSGKKRACRCMTYWLIKTCVPLGISYSPTVVSALTSRVPAVVNFEQHSIWVTGRRWAWIIDRRRHPATRTSQSSWSGLPSCWKGRTSTRSVFKPTGGRRRRCAGWMNRRTRSWRVQGIAGLERLPNIGERLARAIEQYVVGGGIALLEHLQGAANYQRVLATVPGIGPKLAGKIYDELGVETLEELEAAAYDGRLAQVEGFGSKRIRRRARGAGRTAGEPAGRDGAAAGRRSACSRSAARLGPRVPGASRARSAAAHCAAAV